MSGEAWPSVERNGYCWGFRKRWAENDLRRVGGVVLIRAEGAAEATLDEDDSDLMELGLGCCERE